MTDAEVRFHTRIEDLAELDCHATSPFDRSDWFQRLADHGERPIVADYRKEDSRCALVLRRRDGGLEACNHPFAFSWRPLGQPNAASLRALADALRQRASHLAFDGLAEADSLARAFRSAGWWTRIEETDRNHVLFVEGRNFDEYWKSRPGPLRTSVKRKAGKVRVEMRRSFDEAVWSAYRTVYENSWKPEEQFDLLSDFIRAECEAGRGRLGLAWLGDTPVAAQFWTIENATAFIHKLAYDERHAKISAGTVLTAAMFRQAIDEERVQMINFGSGDDAYKSDWMEVVRPRFRLTALDPRQAGAYRWLGGKIGGKVARLLRRR